jgi:hypothetical protein
MTAETIEQETIVAGGAHELMIREPDKERALALMDRLDLEQAMAELRGDVVARFVYTVPGGWDKKNNCKLPDKRQLSYAGVREAARLYKNVHFGATAQQQPDGSWLITPFAHNLADNLSCSLPLPYPAFNPASVNESIAYRAALSKAIRMPLAAVLPITYIEAMISRWTEQVQQPGPGQPRNVTPLRQNQQAAPASPATHATAEDIAPSTREQLMAAISPLLRDDPDAASKLTKELDDHSDDELRKLLAWLQRRKTAGRARGQAAWSTEPQAAEA